MKLTTLQQAEEYVRRGRLKQAARVLKRAVQAGDAPLEYYLRLADVYRLQENWHAAIEAMRDALQRNPDSLALRERLIEMLLESNRTEEAINECQQWMREKPNHPTPLEHMLDAYWQAMDYKQALQIANRLVALLPHSPVYRLRRARLLENLKCYPEAIQDYEFLTLNKETPRDMRLWAIIELGRLDITLLHLMMNWIMEDSVFRMQFLRAPVEAASNRGFVFSSEGEEMLEELAESLRRTSDLPRRYADYS
ncbi:MAG: tetratricopeptide repeat protein [Fimbriimonadales bacterium]|nr:tetratricopeptide repeat protein [Fimbriimonadales bacterium]